MDTKPGLNDLQKGPQMAPGSGVLKAPEPGTEQYPRGGNWNPGPNGDNCVTDQPPPKDMSFDMFVGKTNYVKWVAGKDGSNYKNIDYRKITSDENRSVSEIKNHSFDTFLSEEPAARSALGQPSPGNQGPMSNSEKLKMQGFQHVGFNNYRRNDGTSAKIIRGEIIYYNVNGEVSAEDGGGLSVMGAKPTWTRPSDGQAMTPPAQPETPDEIASVPDPVPAQPPMGYDKFMNRKTLQARIDQERQTMVDIAQKEVDDKYEQVPGGRLFNISTKRLIDDMVNSQDPEDQTIGSIMMDVMVDSSDSIVNALKDIPADGMPDAIQALRRMTEREARERYLLGLQDDEDTRGDDNENEMEDNEELKKIQDEQKKEVEEFKKKNNTNLPEFEGIDLSQKPEYAKQKGFTDTLPRTNEEYVKDLPPELNNGVEFVDLKSVIGDELQSTGIPEKYLDVLSRALVTNKRKGKSDSWSYFGEGMKGGAGDINSQTGELLSLVMGPLSPEGRQKLTEALNKSIDTAKKNGVDKKQMLVTKEWVKAAENNSKALDFYMKLEHGGAKITGAAWDQADELSSLGIGTEGGEEKGFSTDVVYRDENGKNHQISLKKDKNVNFLNSSAAKFNNFVLAGAVQDKKHKFHKEAKAYSEETQKLDELYSSIGYEGGKLPGQKKLMDQMGISKQEAKKILDEIKDSQKTIKELESTEGLVPEEFNQKVFGENQRKLLDDNYRKIKSELKDKSINDITDANDKIEVEKLMKENNITDFEKFFDMVESGDVKGATDERAKRKMRQVAILASGGDVAKEHQDASKKAEQDFATKAITAINEDPNLKAGALSSLRQNFPLKDVSEGKESMLIGDVAFSKDVMKEMFGTDDYSKIQDNLTIETGADGVPYLGYKAEVDIDGDGKSDEVIPISTVNLREKGVGYSSGLGFEMKLRPDFYKRLKDVNEKLGTNFTTEEVVYMMEQRLNLSFDTFISKLNNQKQG